MNNANSIMSFSEPVLRDPGGIEKIEPTGWKFVFGGVELLDPRRERYLTVVSPSVRPSVRPSVCYFGVFLRIGSSEFWSIVMQG